MRWLSGVVLVVAFGCGNSSSVSPDGNGGGGGDDSGGGGNNTPHTVKLTLTNRPNNAGMFSFVVAYQDGSAAWQVAPAPTGDTYSFPIHAPSFGVAFTCIGTPQGTATQLRTVTSAYFAVGERTEVTLDVPPRCSDRAAGNGVMLSGSVANRPVSGTLIVGWGNRTAFVGSQNGNFAMQVPPGTHDLFVVHAVPEGNGDFYTDQVWVQRDVAIAAASKQMIDFTEAQDTQLLNVDINPIDASARVQATTTIYTGNGTQGGLVRESTNWGTQSLADGEMRDSDVYDQAISVATIGHSATITNATNTPTDQTWAAPPPLGMPQSSVATKMPYVTLQSMWPAYPDAAGYMWSATQQLTGSPCGGGGASTTCTINWQAMLSPGVSGAMPGYVMPDLHALAGWTPGLEFATGTTVVGSVTAFTSSAGASDFPVGIPANGTQRTFVRSDYAVTP